MLARIRIIFEFMGYFGAIFSAVFFLFPESVVTLRKLILWNTGLVTHYVPYTKCMDLEPGSDTYENVRVEGHHDGVFDIGKPETIADFEVLDGTTRTISVDNRNIYNSIDEKLGFDVPTEIVARKGDRFYIGKLDHRECTKDDEPAGIIFYAKGLLSKT